MTLGADGRASRGLVMVAAVSVLGWLSGIIVWIITVRRTNKKGLSAVVAICFPVFAVR
jgi:hypothetical protein